MIEAFYPAFSYCALDLLVFADGLWCYQELFILASRFSYALRTVNFTHTRREANHMQTNLRNKQFQESVSLWLECDVVTMF
ncbi:hypothetical protein Peur_044032 [Populus x canadensis]